MKQYYIGFEDAGKRPYGYPQEPGLLIIHAVKNVDYLPPYLWKYFGLRQTTKKRLKETAREILRAYKQFDRVKVV